MKRITNFVSEVLFENGPVIIGITGNSMWPHYTHGQNIKIYPVLSSTLQPGNCYVFAKNNTLIIHRLIAKFSTIALFAGDANNTIERVNCDTIIGKTEKDNCKAVIYTIFIINYLFWPFQNIHFIFHLRKFIIRFILKGEEVYEKEIRKTINLLRTTCH